MPVRRTLRTAMLDVAFEESGPADGWPVVLMHGFPYDIQSYREVAPPLVDAGARVYVPWLRGYGPTRFVDETIPRSGEQAVLGVDLLQFLDALAIERPVLAGYDWGGRAACIVAALWPGRVRALVSVNSYNIQDIARAGQPQPPENEHRHWYQYYFHGERGRRGLESDRRAFCRLLWTLWSPTWRFDDATFERSAAAFDNPDFVDVVIHSYRHRYGLVPGDPAVADVEHRLAARPAIDVPTITIDGADDGVMGVGGTASHASRFTARHEHRIVAGAGHNPAQEKPEAFADAVLTVHRWTSSPSA